MDRQAYVALGSNLGDRRAYLVQGLEGLARTAGIRVVSVSPVYETEAVGPPQGPYLNAAAGVRTRLSPRALLARLLAVEAEAGRVRGERHGPRTLDLDLLLYEDVQLAEPDLELPHPRMAERAFVLGPLCDIAPEVVHPGLGLSVRELWRGVPDPGSVRPFGAPLRLPSRPSCSR